MLYTFRLPISIFYIAFTACACVDCVYIHSDYVIAQLRISCCEFVKSCTSKPLGFIPILSKLEHVTHSTQHSARGYKTTTLKILRLHSIYTEIRESLLNVYIQFVTLQTDIWIRYKILRESRCTFLLCFFIRFCSIRYLPVVVVVLTDIDVDSVRIRTLFLAVRYRLLCIIFES